MLLVNEVLGTADDPRFRGRRVERLALDWADASKRRVRRATDAGTDVAIDVARGTYLAEGAVLADDGDRIVVVERRREAALIVRFDRGLAAADLVRGAVLLGHAFGNQHVPLDVEDREVRIPLTTSEEIARATVERLGLDGVTIDVTAVALGRTTALATGHAHEGGHVHRRAHE